MGWKELPSWVKGGIIGVILFLLSLSLFLVYDSFFGTISIIRLSTAFIFVSAYPVQIIFNLLLGEDNLIEKQLIGCSAFLVWLLLGTLIGWIVGKVKKKKK